MRVILGALRLLTFLILVALVIIIQSIVFLFTKGPASYVVPRIWHKIACATLGVKVRHVGQIYEDHQTIYMSNHLSYLDITALGSAIKGSYVAKREVKGWALFGFLSSFQQTAFVSRKKTTLGEEKDSLGQMIADHKNLIIFPEGTSTDGQSVRAFKSSFFMLAFEERAPDLVVQPITIRVDRVEGRKVERQDDRDLYAWHIDMDTPLHVHLWRFVCSRGAEISVIFHPPLRAIDYSDRKVLCSDCFDAVSSGLLDIQVA